MPSLIIYSTDKRRLDKTIDGILDRTRPADIDEIVVCDDTGEGYSRPGVRTHVTTGVGRAKAWNHAAAAAVGQRLVFLKDRTKVGTDWLPPLVEMLNNDDSALVSPVVHTLDIPLWTTEVSRWRRFGWRWDLNIYDRAFAGRPDSPAISSYCIACDRRWFTEIGGFDQGMDNGAGEDIEIALRSWLFGGSVKVADDSLIAVALELDYGPHTVNNLARIVEAWLPGQASRFYGARGLVPQDVNTGRLNNLLRLQEKQKRPIEWFLSTRQPELFSIYDLKGAAVGRSVAVIGPGASLDYVNFALINRHDIVIGVDYVGLLFDCDYVITDSIHIISELRSKYSDQKFVVPVVLHDRQAGRPLAAAELLPLSQQFEMAQSGVALTSADPPLCNFDNMVLTAAHFALFLGPTAVTVFGCDNKIIGGKSHTSKIEYYDNGQIWPDSESTRRKFAFYEYGLDQLGRLAHACNIPLLRVCHA
jgi:hypothetical protein